MLDVESAEFQTALSNSFDDELYLIMIEEELDTADTYGDEMNDLYELWLSGDRDAFWTMIAEEDGKALKLLLDLNDEAIRMIRRRNAAAVKL